MWVVGPGFEDFFRKFDDKFIKIFQHFIIKKPHSTIFGRIMAWLIYYISLIMVCKAFSQKSAFKYLP